MVQTAPLRSITADAVAKAFCEAWVFKFGPPALLLSDNGGQFTSKFFQNVGKILGVRQIVTTAYHPQTNGQVERFNRTILAGLKRFRSEHGRDWDEFSSAITFAYNNMVHRVTGLTTLQLVLTGPPSPLSPENVEQIDYYAVGPRQSRDIFTQSLRALMKTANPRRPAVQIHYKTDFDKRVRHRNRDLQTGELFFVRRETFTALNDQARKRYDVPAKDSLSFHKLTSKAIGPFPILKVQSHTITITRDGLSDTVSKDRVIRAPALYGNQDSCAAPRQAQSPGRLLDTDEAEPSNNPNSGPYVAINYPENRLVNIDNSPQSFSDVLLARRTRSSAEINPNTVLDDEDPTRQSSASEADVPPRFDAKPGAPVGFTGPEVRPRRPPSTDTPQTSATETPQPSDASAIRRLSHPRRLQRMLKTTGPGS